MELLRSQEKIKTQILQEIKANRNCLIIGKAGSGKTLILDNVIKQCKEDYKWIVIKNDDVNFDLFNYLTTKLEKIIHSKYNETYKIKYKYDNLKEINRQVHIISEKLQKKIIFVLDSFYDLIPEQQENIIEFLNNFFNLIEILEEDSQFIILSEENSINELKRIFPRFQRKLITWKIIKIPKINHEDISEMIQKLNKEYNRNVKIEDLKISFEEFETPLQIIIEYLKQIIEESELNGRK
ncbi:MAG: GTP-binding protein [Candidatus Helarchaeota archaeon]